jgi:hypothetical protein
MLCPADLVAVVAAVLLFAVVVSVFGAAVVEAVTAPSFLVGGGVKGVLPLLPFRFHSRRSFFSLTGISVGVAPLAAAAAASASSFFRKAAMVDIGGSAMTLLPFNSAPLLSISFYRYPAECQIVPGHLGTISRVLVSSITIGVVSSRPVPSRPVLVPEFSLLDTDVLGADYSSLE